jgi:hypothetical protein
MRLTQISHPLNELGILTFTRLISNSQLLIASMKKRIYPGSAVAHISNKYYLAADMARDGEIHMSYVPTAEMLADCFTKPLPKPAFWKQCAVPQCLIGSYSLLLTVLFETNVIAILEEC